MPARPSPLPLLLACVLGGLWLAPGDAQAQRSAQGAASAKSALERGEAAYDDLEFEQAAKHFRAALAAPGTRDDRIRAYRGLGMCLAFLGEATAAQLQFETLLLISPDSTVDTGLGPKVVRPFNAALRAVADRQVELKLERDDRTGEVTARLNEGIDAASRVVLHVRPVERGERTAGEAMTAEAKAPGPARMTLEPWRGAEAWATAEDAGGGVLFSAGSADAPRRFTASARAPSAEAGGALDFKSEEGWAPEEPRPTRWPLWVGGAAVLIGGGVAAAIAMRPPEPLLLPSANRTGRLP